MLAMRENSSLLSQSRIWKACLCCVFKRKALRLAGLLIMISAVPTLVSELSSGGVAVWRLISQCCSHPERVPFCFLQLFSFRLREVAWKIKCKVIQDLCLGTTTSCYLILQEKHVSASHLPGSASMFLICLVYTTLLGERHYLYFSHEDL